MCPVVRNTAHLAQILLEGVCYVPASLGDEAVQTPELVQTVFQRFALPSLESLPGPLHQ